MRLPDSLFNLEISARATLGAAIRRPAAGCTDIYLCLVDHYEPHVGKPDEATARARHNHWLREYPTIAARHRDWDDRAPAHSFFYPYDEYDPWELETLVELCAAGWGEVNLHLHHRDDTSESLRATLRDAIRTFDDAGALTRWPDGRPAFGFIHGNWALANSRHEGGRNFCGVNDEISILIEEGCFADFTFPAWQHTAQPRQVNSIYYAAGCSSRPKSYDRGVRAAAQHHSPENRLLLIQGPLSTYFRRTAGRIRPAVDDGDLAHSRPYEPARLDRWVRTGVHVHGRPDKVFIKLHCHGAEDKNRELLLGRDLEALFSDAEARYNDGSRYRLHYVTAREMFNVVKSIESGADRDLIGSRDSLLPRPRRAGGHLTTAAEAVASGNRIGGSYFGGVRMTM